MAVEAPAETHTDVGSRRRDALVVGAAKVAALAFVAYSGFLALSDDDYARVVISQELAAKPKLDPSGTSWLPFPFWLDGSLMAVLGRKVSVARASTAALAVGSSLLVLVAARWIGVPRRGATLGALAACAIPYAAWLGIATVPEGWTAALVLLAAASMVSESTLRRTVGGAALAVATLSRYEAWPVAAAFAAITLYDLVRQRRWGLAGAIVLAVLGPAAWMAHGAVHHGSATFFVDRVTAYREALGASDGSATARFFWYPLAALRAEPELALATGIAAFAAARAGAGKLFRKHLRPAVALGAMLLTLSIGYARGGAPTHHNERTLLAIWLLFAVLFGDAAHAAWRGLDRRGRSVLVGSIGVALLVGATVLRPWYARRDDFVDRRAEVAIGRYLRGHDPPKGDRLAVDTEDFGFYAVIAGFGRPESASALDDHDPRSPPKQDPFESADALERAIAEHRARWLVARAKHLDVAEQVGKLVTRNQRFLLLEVTPTPTAHGASDDTAGAP